MKWRYVFLIAVILVVYYAFQAGHIQIGGTDFRLRPLEDFQL